MSTLRRLILNKHQLIYTDIPHIITVISSKLCSKTLYDYLLVIINLRVKIA
jgi:hypothetical protein